MDALEKDFVPPELLDAFRSLAVRDCEGTCRLLELLYPDAIKRPALPRETLIGLGLAIRLSRWELVSIDLHIQAGLPSGQQMLDRVADLGHGPELWRIVQEVLTGANRIFAESFLWGDSDVDQVDLAVVSDSDDEDFLDAMADFIWHHRKKVNRG
ncbi:MAG TPA: hypothetical protein VMP01_03045 [Pirellulaceae bacterium]|nr:hypothetical protein [Pirellulaceae bacterium]